MTRRAKLVIGLVFAAFSLQLAGLLPVFPVLLDGLHLLEASMRPCRAASTAASACCMTARCCSTRAQTPFFFFQSARKVRAPADMRR
jgi:hypothetical protein